METQQTVQELSTIWEKISAGEIFSLTLTEWILIVGIITLTFFACKIIHKAFKVILVILIVLLILAFALSKGWLAL